jgi:hypothetical protein
VVDQRSIAVSEEVVRGVDQTTTNTANVMKRRRAGLAARRSQVILVRCRSLLWAN